jgi:hypothetical protein
VGLRVLRDAAPLLIDLVEEGGETSEGAHGLLRVWQGYTRVTRVEKRVVHDNKASKYHNSISL